MLTADGQPQQLRAATAVTPPPALLSRHPRLAPWMAIGPLFLRESGTGLAGTACLGTAAEDLRHRTDLGALPLLLFQLAREEATSDRWELAAATYDEGIRLAREAGYTSDLAACLAGLAWLEARQGRELDCRRHAAEALALCLPRQIALFQAWSLCALGELELGLGRAAEAVERFTELDAMLTDLALADVALYPGPDLVEALVRSGRVDEARAPAESYLERAEAKGQPWALARAERAVALITGPDGQDLHFARALAHHARTPDAFELARTRLALGAALRRARRRAEARQPLREALATFEKLGARPWSELAAVELEATGETARRRRGNPLADLTPQELQVARMLAAGRSTREAAAALFLSPKTVEYHLRHVYLKLSISSRDELARRFGE